MYNEFITYPMIFPSIIPKCRSKCSCWIHTTSGIRPLKMINIFFNAYFTVKRLLIFLYISLF